MKSVVAALAAVLVLLAGGCATVMMLGAAAGPGANLACAPGSSGSGAVMASDVPDVEIAGYGPEQLGNAVAIINAGHSLGLPARAQTIAVMTAMGESSLRVLDRGDSAGPDSRGLFQQRNNGAWGSYEDRMDPTRSALSFYRALVDVAGWETLPPTMAAHRVQRNADPWHYERHWPAAVQVVTILTGDTALASALPQAGGFTCAAGTFTGGGRSADGTWPPEACSVRPDPTNGRGCITPRTAALAQQFLQASYEISCWDEHAWNPRSDHPRGTGCDVTFGELGRFPAAAERAHGDQVAAQLIATADRTGIKYLIWQGRIWHASRADQGWLPYSGGGVYDATSPTGGHYDHIHISVH